MDICIRRVALSDGSYVYNVELGGLVFSAVTERDAAELAQKFQHAIHDHTNDRASLVWQFPDDYQRVGETFREFKTRIGEV